MTDELASRISRRLILGAGLVLPVTFVTGAEAQSLVKLAYDSQSDNPSGPDNSANTTGTDNSSNTTGTDNSGNTTGTDNSANTTGTDNSTNTTGTDNSTNTNSTDNSTNTNATDNSTNVNATDNSTNIDATDNSTYENVPEDLPPQPVYVTQDSGYSQLSGFYVAAAAAVAVAATAAVVARSHWQKVRSTPGISPAAVAAALANLQKANNAHIQALNKALAAQTAATKRAKFLLAQKKSNG